MNKFMKDSIAIFDKDEEDEPDDETICGAMLLAATHVGARITKIAKAIEQPLSRIRWIFNNLRDQGVFTSKGRVEPGGDWFAEDPLEAHAAFVLDACCGLGLMERA